MHIHFLNFNAGPLRRFFAEAGHADHQIKHLADGGALRIAITHVAPENIVRRNAPLPVSRARQRNQRRRLDEQRITDQ